MSDTRARINKLRQIRRQMEKEIRMVEVEAARREKRRSQQKEERERLNRAKKHKQEDVSLVNNRVLINKTDQECKFFILTRNLILAASNRQLKSAFLLWRRKAGLERPKKTRRFVSNIPTRRRVTKRDEIARLRFTHRFLNRAIHALCGRTCLRRQMNGRSQSLCKRRWRRNRQLRLVSHMMVR